jgi:hypothetical protein
MSTFAEKAIKYFLSLKTPANLPENIVAINPHKESEVKTAVKHFFKNYFNDSKNRLFVFGINPGRFGGGLTGIAFTDPVALSEVCGIKNNLGTRRELSSKFVYNLIDEFGGAQKFFGQIYLTALYPLAILRDGKNYNYYDRPALYRALKKHIECSIKEQLRFGARNDIAISLGKKNAKYLEEINDEYKFFKEIIVLDHPRYIMQYKLQHMDKYLKDYLSAMSG